MLKAAIFDLYGTLVDIHTDEESDLFWEQFALYLGYKVQAVDYKEIRMLYEKFVKKHIENVTDTQYPDIEILNVFEDLYGHYNVKVDRRDLEETAKVFRLLSTDYIKLYPHAKDLLDTLKSNDLKVILLSNAQSAFTLPEMHLLGILSDFDKIYISSDYEMTKPEYKFLKQVMVDFDLKSEEAFFIGNDPRTDIVIANAFDMKSIYLQTSCSPEFTEDIPATHVINPGNLKTTQEILLSYINA